MKIILLLIISLFLTVHEAEFNQIKRIVVKEKAFHVNANVFENMYQLDYLLEVPFQYDTFKNSDFKLLKKQGWELCKSESFNWQEFKDISGDTPKWISNKSINFYKDKSKRLTLGLMYEANSNLEVKASRIQKIVIGIVYLTEEQLQQIEKAGLPFGCNNELQSIGSV